MSELTFIALAAGGVGFVAGIFFCTLVDMLFGYFDGGFDE